MIVYLLVLSVTINLILFGLLFKSHLNLMRLQETLSEQTERLAKEKTQQETLQKEVTRLSKTLEGTFEDPITHLISWNFFQDRLSQTIKESERYQFTLGILYIDIDDFNVVNDALGYEVGDLLLKEIATRLQTCIRQVDSISRLSKDTFVALLSQLAKPETAALVAQRMLQALNQPFQINNNELYLTACIGVAIFPADGQDAATLLRNAEAALALAKEKDKNLYQFYQEKIHLNSQRELYLHTSMRRDTIYKEFNVLYQPIVNAANESVFAMHAQLTWPHPDIGIIDEKEIYAYAEKQRKLSPVFEWFLEKACRDFAQWKMLGFTPNFLTILVPTKLLESTQFIHKLSQILQETGFNPENLLLEFHDSFAAIEINKLEKAANMLKFLGVKTAINDFGSGNFSFLQFKSFPINFLKIDRGLTADIETNYQSMALVKSMAFLAKNLAIDLIAKDIATVEQMIQLREIGCQLIQGTLFSTALPENEVVVKMKQLTLSHG